jgi:hypothetical protein
MPIRPEGAWALLVTGVESERASSCVAEGAGCNG